MLEFETKLFCKNLKQNFIIRSKRIHEMEQNFKIKIKTTKLGTKNISKMKKMGIKTSNREKKTSTFGTELQK